VKHFEDSLKCVKKENFNLKLKIFFLEEKLSTGDETSDLSLIQANTDLKIQVENMKQDLNDKLDLLLEARDAIEKLEEKVEEQKEQHIKEIFAVENKVNLANLNNNKNCNSCNKRKKLKPSNLSERAVFSATDRSTESLVLEVLEELEEFTEREKNFDNKYTKTISELKSESSKTEEELGKIKEKMLSYEEEIESLNANLDNKNEFITALQHEIQEKTTDSEYFIDQLEHSTSIIKMMEQEVSSLKFKLRFRKKKNNCNKSTSTGSDIDNFDVVRYLEEEILFKNQELKELLADLHCRDEEIKMWEESWYRSQQQSYKQTEKHFYAQI